jgi:hypothetical protein
MEFYVDVTQAFVVAVTQKPEDPEFLRKKRQLERR